MISHKGESTHYFVNIDKVYIILAVETFLDEGVSPNYAMIPCLERNVRIAKAGV